MKIWVASLTDYNAGILHGKWFEISATSDVGDLHKKIAALLATSPTAREEDNPAEEWAIHDYSECPVDFGEHESLNSLVGFARAYESFVEDSAREGFAIYVEKIAELDACRNNWAAALENFHNAYRGEWATLASYAEDYFGEMHSNSPLPEMIADHINWASVYNDLTNGAVYDYRSSNGFHVFHCPE
ncbi:antirestriction protein ArdA [Nocardia sp. NPDC058518]|uniref:antirestriction protein ArdA n=1 Tax=Nocardia sp. NPDC058518 TaxID=3346534 RepID=UPI00366A0AE2